MKKQINLIKNLSELGAGTRGAGLAYEALKVAALNKSYDFFHKIPCSEVVNYNNIISLPTKTPHARYINKISRILESLCHSVGNVISNDNIPIIISGDHSSGYGSISGIKVSHPKKRVGVIWIDAHADIHSPYTTPSGNIHGMPLAAALNLNHKDMAINKLDSNTSSYWDYILETGGIKPKILPEDIVYVGVRDVEPAEQTIINKLGIKNITVEELRSKGADHAGLDALTRLSKCDTIYISFDIDSLDPNKYSYGTGTPVENGLYLEEVLKFLDFIYQEKSKVGCFEITEINPLLDNKKNLMAEVGIEVLKHFFYHFN